MLKAASVFVALLASSFAPQAQQITGDYIESRSADVYVAQCFANGETLQIALTRICIGRYSSSVVQVQPVAEEEDSYAHVQATTDL
jgi:hypothetical protein